MLRFWESRFSQISPMKKGGGRRYYRPEDITLLSGIRALLYDDGLSIKNVQAHIKSNGISAICARSEERAAVHDASPEVVSQQTVLMPEAEDVETPELNTVVSTPSEGAQNSETHDRLSGALQKLMDARERLNETLE